MPISRSLALKAIVFDWAGTLVDHGSRAPVEAFREVFRRAGVPISADEARGPMGMDKRDHILALLARPRIAELWQDAQGHSATDDEVGKLYHGFLGVQLELLTRHADVIPGVLDVLAQCRQRGLRIGSSSGYAEPLMRQLVPLAQASDLHVDAVVSASDVAAGRPAPWMIVKNMELLNAYPPAAVVTVDDTLVGIEAGRNAGTWAVGVVETGNMFGLSAAELEHLAEGERASRRARGCEAMRQGGAHYALRSVADLVPLLDEINERLARGERP